MKNKIFKLLPYVLLVLVIVVIYKNWFSGNEIIGGDWPYFFQEEINSFTPLPPSWSNVHGNGLGGKVMAYALDSYLYFTGWFFSQTLHIPWHIVYKVFWFGLFLVLTLFSSIYLIKSIFPNSSSWQKALAAFLYITNTYILLIVSGGQLGIAFAYALAPLVLAKFISLITLCDKDTVSHRYEIVPASLLASFVFSIQVLFDLRLAYIMMVAVGLYWLLHTYQTFSKKSISTLFTSLVYTFIIPGLITGLLHAFWLLPTVLSQYNPLQELGSAYTSVGSLQFFSFATFSNALGLLHPNWPENIFGKVSFMKPEFLLLPLLAFLSFLFIPNKSPKYEQILEKRIMLFFALVGLVGVFFAKGANEPFGQVYIWLFEHIPGFVMFRDPTKWYLLIALSYSVLISFSVHKIYTGLSMKFKKNRIPAYLFSLIIIIGLLFLIRQSLMGQIGGTFQRTTVPHEYSSLTEFLAKDKNFSRTLWVPRQSRFAYNDSLHPSIEAMPLFKATSSAEIINTLRDKKTPQYLTKLSVKYLIIPYDTSGEIFQKERKYDKKQYEEYIKELEKISWLERLPEFKNVAVFKTKKYNEHISLLNEGEITYDMVHPYHYNVSVETLTGNTVLFSENYYPNWELHTNNKSITSEKTAEGLQHYVIPAGTYSGEIIFEGQKIYMQGLLISFVSFCLLLLSYFVLQYISFLIYLKNTF